MEKRDSGIWVGDDGRDWYHSSTAIAIKWAILASLVLLILLFFLGGYLHAQRRMKRGLAPLSYHRWFIPRRQLAQFDAPSWYAYNSPSFHQAQDQGYQMHAMPPPAYNPNLAPPPVYQAPAGASKVDPSQQPQYQHVWTSQSGPDAPLPHPPATGATAAATT